MGNDYYFIYTKDKPRIKQSKSTKSDALVAITITPSEPQAQHHRTKNLNKEIPLARVFMHARIAIA